MSYKNKVKLVTYSMLELNYLFFGPNCYESCGTVILVFHFVHFGHYIVSFYLQFFITPLISSNFWPLCCLSYFYLQFFITPLISSNFWPLCCLSFFYLQFFITPLIIFKLLATVLSVFLLFTISDYTFGIFKLFFTDIKVKSNKIKFQYRFQSSWCFLSYL
jgi:hypothetical protein